MNIVCKHIHEKKTEFLEVNKFAKKKLSFLYTFNKIDFEKYIFAVIRQVSDLVKYVDLAKLNL